MRKETSLKNTFHTREVVFLILLTCIVSLIMGITISKRVYTPKNSDKLDPMIEKLNDTYQYIKENYYGSIDEQKLLNGAMNGMVEALDDKFSIFIDNDENENFNLSLNGNYTGVGIEVTNNKEGNIVIISVFDNSPAKKAGLLAGDIVKSVNNTELLGKDKSELTNLIQKNNKKEFTIKIIREEKEIEMILKKATVEIPSVISKIIEKNQRKVGYIYFNIFSNTTYSQFQKQLEELEKQKMDSLIIDVRQNSGGHLTTAVDILSLFMDSKHVIYQTETKQEKKKFYSTGKVNKKYPIVVIQDEDSASASELLSAALKESYGATIVGKKSYGKGTVQTLLPFTSHTEYKITTKKWLTPNGNWINEKGVIPDIDVSLEDSYFNNPTDETDTQLQAALQYLMEKEI